MTGMCSCCGANLARDVEIVDGDWTLDPRGTVSYQGVIIASGSRAELLHTLAKDGGRVVSRDNILRRLGAEQCQSILIDQHVHRLRVTCKRLGVPDPVQTVPTEGYAWKPRYEEQLAKARQLSPAGAPVNFRLFLKGEGRVMPKIRSHYDS